VRLAAWPVGGKWMLNWKEAVVAKLRHYPDIFSEDRSEIAKNSGCPVCKPANRWRRRRKVCLIQNEAAESSVRRWNSFNNSPPPLLLSLLTSYKKQLRPPHTTGFEHTIKGTVCPRPYTDQTVKLTSSADMSLFIHEIRVVK